MVNAVHDAQLDYFGRKLATCSSDNTVRVFDVDGDQHTLVATLRGHEGPVWQVSWAHPRFGTLLATGSFDGRVLIWKETAPGQWEKAREHRAHAASVNAVAWAPHEYGLALASAGSDGKVSVLKCNADRSWTSAEFAAHAVGVNAVSWCPPAPAAAPAPAADAGSSEPQAAAPGPWRLATAGCDNVVRIWAQLPNGTWAEERVLKAHTDWVRDVAWSPNLGLATHHLATCGQDKQVFVYTFDPSAAGPGSWACRPLRGNNELFPDVVWRVSWSPSGNILAVSCGDNKVTLWKENLDGEWQLVGDVVEGASQ